MINFIAGAALGSGIATFVAVLVVGLILSDLRRVRHRLQGIIDTARSQKSRIDGVGWGAERKDFWDLYDAVAPYEEA